MALGEGGEGSLLLAGGEAVEELAVGEVVRGPAADRAAKLADDAVELSTMHGGSLSGRAVCL
jgi:hypothetical protein